MELKKGDRVRVTFETTVLSPGINNSNIIVDHPSFLGSATTCNVPRKYIELIDSPMNRID